MKVKIKLYHYFTAFKHYIEIAKTYCFQRPCILVVVTCIGFFPLLI